MRRLCLVLGAALAVLLGPVNAAGAAQFGEIRMTLHTHSSDNPNDPGLFFPTDRLPYLPTTGKDFSYSSRLCRSNAPFNDIGLDFIPDYPGVDDDADHTARVRHRIQGTVIASAGTRGVIRGKITTVLCEGTGATSVPTGHVIVSNYQALFTVVDDNNALVFGAVQISPTESTGTFKDMTGGGTLQGRFTCLGHQGNPSAPSCAQLGYYTDFVGHTGDPTLPPGQLQPGYLGRYFDPTVTTGGGSGSSS